MRTQSSDQMKTYKGIYKSVRLDVIHDGLPLTKAERSGMMPNYPTELGFLHIYLDGEDTSAQVPSGYLFRILLGLMHGLADLIAGQHITVSWLSDPWKFDIKSDSLCNCAYITLHLPGRWAAIDNASVPLDLLCKEIVRIAEKWENYLLQFYRDEMLSVKWGEPYQRFKDTLSEARDIVRSYTP